MLSRCLKLIDKSVLLNLDLGNGKPEYCRNKVVYTSQGL
jgi:hypothetical protein